MWRTSTAGRWSPAVFGLSLFCGALGSLFALWLLSGLFAPLAPRVRGGLLLIVAVGAVARDWGLLSMSLPQAARQIPRDVLQAGPLRGALQFGFELGTCARTYMTGSAPYVVAAAVLLLAPRPGHVIVAAAGVAVGRITPLLQALGADRESLLLELSATQRLVTTSTAVLALAGFAALVLLPA